MPPEEPMIIGFDLDGVIIDHTQNKMRIAARYGVILAPEETHAEFMGAHFSPELYLTIKSQLYDATDDALLAPLMSGAFSGLAKLREHGIPYYLVSLQKNPMHALQLIERCGLWGEYFTPENTFFAEHANEKHEIASRLGVTHFVDDESRILSVMSSIPSRILFDARELFGEKDEFARVKDWAELEQVFGIANR